MTATSGSRTPLLGSSSHQRIGNERDSDRLKFVHVLQFFGGGIYAPDETTYDPLEILLNTEDEDDRDELTIKWRDNKLSELNFVGVVAALLAGVLTSTGSWPNILPNGQKSPWSVRTSWYCGIILSLFSILTAADQTVRLHRLSAHRDGLENIRKLLSKTNGERSHSSKTGRRRPSLLQIFTWQMPVMFLTSATLCMIVGMFLHVWSATSHLDRPSLWDDNTKVAVTYSVVAVAAITIFFVGQVSLFVPLRK
ncbi:myosin-cross-reactive antigen family [Pyrenophora seminiperda CCB06]|uniref:Myosin-cross-reactive antigen family n=1 Tax=Pyrenophora seminiperda CCB06 TaxID=1302712 RepID=A0A3M7MDV3_9PLEO|nr:myosin-cross-reactive antigen family [Pyrenophora seminiperda CCB06]